MIGVRRILSTLAHYKIPGTFYIPGHTAYAFPKSVQDIAAAGHEIGHHGWIHENSRDRAAGARRRWILEKGFQALKDVAGVRPFGYRSPAWDNSPGGQFRCCSNSALNTRAARWRPTSSLIGAASAIPSRWTNPMSSVSRTIWSSCRSRGTSMTSLSLSTWLSKGGVIQGVQTPHTLLQIWKDEFDYLYNRIGKGLFSVTMHPQVIGRAHRLLLLERIIEHVEGQTWGELHDDDRLLSQVERRKDA